MHIDRERNSEEKRVGIQRTFQRLKHYVHLQCTWTPFMHLCENTREQPQSVELFLIYPKVKSKKNFKNF